MNCPFCGNEIPSGAAFCGNCGAAVNAGGTQDTSAGHSDAYQYFENSSQTGNGGFAAGGQDQSGYQQNGYQQNGYQQGGYQPNPQPPVYGGATRREIAVCVILSVVTMGIYGLYWFVVMTDDMNRVTGDTTATSGGMALLFTIISCGIYGIYWAYKMGEKADMLKGQPGGSSPVLYLVLAIFGLQIVNYCLIQDTLNKCAA